MIPVMYGIELLKVPLWVNIMVTQIVGALVFWRLDKWLFNHKIKSS